MTSNALRERLMAGMVIPAHPLALTQDRRLDEGRQYALTRRYLQAGAGGIAVGVHTTQFAIRDPGVNLYVPVLRLAAEAARDAGPVLVAGICGRTRQAVHEAETAAGLGYHAGLLSLSALADADDAALLAHCRAVGRVLPLFGFYLQTAVGGRPLSLNFWRRFLEIDAVVAVKVAPFNRYQTLDVARALAESGRAGEVALYTGNDDAIVWDLLSEYVFGGVRVTFRGGLLGQWAVGTRSAVAWHRRLSAWRDSGQVPREALLLAAEWTDLNAALFDAANGFAGCIAGIHEALRRQGHLAGRWCLDPHEDLSPGQEDEIARVMAAYPHLLED